MIGSKVRALGLSGCSLLLLPALGCAFAADLINPDFLRQLGFDPATIVPPPGKVVVSFTNSTSQSANFYAYFAEEQIQGQVTRGSNLTAVVPPGMTSSDAVDCPFEFVTPGSLNDDFSVDDNAVTLSDGGTQTQVAYEGAPLVMGVDFVCGDLIDIRLVETGGGQADGQQQDQAQYSLRIQVYPGR